jgi:hypothetical protein
MDWFCRLGRIGGFVATVAAGVTACGKTYMPAPSPDPVPASQAAVCLPDAAPAGPIAVAIAGPPDAAGASDPAAAIARVLSQIAAAATAPGCVSPRPGPAATPADGQDTVVVERVGDHGARDALDQGAGILVTRDRSVVAYAASQPNLISVPLPWDRVYVMVVRGQPGRPDSAAEPLKAALASDAIHADARAFGAGTVLPDTACSGDAGHPANAAVAPLAAPGRVRGAARRILYDQEDSVARFLAERMAVLASTGSSLLAGIAPALGRTRSEMYAAGLPASELARAMMDGSGAASIVALPLPSCGDAGALPANALRLTIQSSERQLAIVPLIETRAWAIVRRDAVPRIAALSGRAIVAEDWAP